jgi:hypothetical protein
MDNPIHKLQEQPYETRVKILWVVVAIVAVILLVLIVTSIKDTISNVGGNLVQIEAAKFVPDSPVAYASVERVEANDKTLKVYFNLNNSGNDILNVPKLAEITFSVGNNVFRPQKITDRQGNPFVQKVLSHTQNFGILFFPAVNGTKGTLLFDQMSLEQATSNVFQQKIWLDLNQLSKNSQVRN